MRSISDDTAGLTNDNLAAGLDLVGTVEADGKTIDILVEKTEGLDGGPIWLFSSETVQQIPTIIPVTGGFTIDRILPAFLVNNKWGGVPVGHWLAMLVLVALAYLVAWGFITLIVGAIRFFWSKASCEHPSKIIQAFALPVRIYLTVWIFVWLSQEVGISIIARQKL